MEQNEQRSYQAFEPTSKRWWRRLGQAYWYAGKDLFTDGGMHWAGSIAFYSFLSIIPLLLAIVTVASFFVEPTWVIEQLNQVMGELVPEGEDQIQDIVEGAYAARGGAGLASIAVLLWSGTRVFGTLTTAMNICFDVEETYSFSRRLIYEGVHLLSLGVLFLIAVASRSAIYWLLGWLEWMGEEAFFLVQYIPGIASAILLTVAFALIYRFVPRRRPTWWSSMIGAVTTTLCFLAARPLFLFYIVQFADYDMIYGPIALVVILVFWVWLVALIILFGAEVASHVQSLIVDDMSVEEVRLRHRKRSPIKSAPGEDDPST